MRIPITTKKIYKQAMTSIELVVVFGIFAALAATVLFNYREFNLNIKLQNLSQDIALQIRRAQNLSVSGSFPPLVSGQTPPPVNWTPSYGVYFSTNEEQNDRFVFFFDRPVSNIEPFNVGDRQISNSDITCSPSNVDSECLDVIQITTGERISDICLDQFTYGGSECFPVDEIFIVFARPLNRAYFSYPGMTDEDFISDVSVYIESPSGSRSVVRVTATGQIIVE